MREFNCVNCGAPVSGDTCEYCGTPNILKLKFGVGDKIRVVFEHEGMEYEFDLRVCEMASEMEFDSTTFRGWSGSRLKTVSRPFETRVTISGTVVPSKSTGSLATVRMV